MPKIEVSLVFPSHPLVNECHHSSDVIYRHFDLQENKSFFAVEFYIFQQQEKSGRSFIG